MGITVIARPTYSRRRSSGTTTVDSCSTPLIATPIRNRQGSTRAIPAWEAFHTIHFNLNWTTRRMPGSHATGLSFTEAMICRLDGTERLVVECQSGRTPFSADGKRRSKCLPRPVQHSRRTGPAITAVTVHAWSVRVTSRPNRLMHLVTLTISLVIAPRSSAITSNTLPIKSSIPTRSHHRPWELMYSPIPPLLEKICSGGLEVGELISVCTKNSSLVNESRPTLV